MTARFEIIHWIDRAATLPPLPEEEPELPLDEDTEIAA